MESVVWQHFFLRKILKQEAKGPHPSPEQQYPNLWLDEHNSIRVKISWQLSTVNSTQKVKKSADYFSYITKPHCWFRIFSILIKNPPFCGPTFPQGHSLCFHTSFSLFDWMLFEKICKVFSLYLPLLKFDTPQLCNNNATLPLGIKMWTNLNLYYRRIFSLLQLLWPIWVWEDV